MPGLPVLTRMADGVEIWRGGVNTWECDEMGHMNVRFYVTKAVEGLVGLAAALGLPHAFTAHAGSTLMVREQHIRFLREAQAGAALHMTGGVLEMGEAEARLLMLLWHSDSGALAASFQTVVAHVTPAEGRPFPWPRRTLELSVTLLKRHPTLKISLNVSGLTCSDHEWLVTLQRLTGGRKELTNRMAIEITETAAIQDLDQSINFVDTLKELGCRVAIDDFGAGYTSFKNLKLLNVDMVKIDGAFVKNMVDDTSDQIFIKTMIELSNTFGLETVAEWVGDQEAADMLIKAGITYLQGFHYGLPFDSETYSDV